MYMLVDSLDNSICLSGIDSLENCVEISLSKESLDRMHLHKSIILIKIICGIVSTASFSCKKIT